MSRYAIRKDVMNYVNMIIGIDAENLGPDKMWKYKDPQTGELKALKIDERYIKSVEERLGLKTEEQRETFRTSIRKIYGQKISVDPNYDFMDNLELVKAVTDVRLKIGHRRGGQPDRRPGQPHQRGEPEALRPDDRHHAEQARLLPDLRAEDDRVLLHPGRRELSSGRGELAGHGLCDDCGRSRLSTA